MYDWVNMLNSSVHRWSLLSMAALPLFAAGCSQTVARGSAAANAPTLGAEGQAHIRGVSDPNAPFTLVDRTKSTTTGSFSEGENAAIPCGASTLQMYEAAASMNGDARVVTLAFKNRGSAVCRLSGYPSIELQDESGVGIAGIAIRQTSALSLSGTVVGRVEDASAGAPVDVVLRPSAEATFEIGWSSGDGCPLVSRFTVAVPGEAASGDNASTFSGSFTVNHPLNVCNGEVRVTALMASGAA
jgi:hypothetical protein